MNSMTTRKNLLLGFVYIVSFIVNLINFLFCIFIFPKINNDSYVPQGKFMNSIMNFYNAGGGAFVIETMLVSLFVMLSVWLLFRHFRIGYILYVFSMATLVFLPMFLPDGIFYFTYKTFPLFKLVFQIQVISTIVFLSIVSISFFRGKI